MASQKETGEAQEDLVEERQETPQERKERVLNQRAEAVRKAEELGLSQEVIYLGFYLANSLGVLNGADLPKDQWREMFYAICQTWDVYMELIGFDVHDAVSVKLAEVLKERNPDGTEKADE